MMYNKAKSGGANMKTYAIFLDNEECTAYERIQAENLNDALDEAVEEMKDNVEEDGWTFTKTEENKINMYFNGDWQNEVTVEAIEE